MINLPAEVGRVSENLPFGSRASPSGLSQGRFSQTLPPSAGRVIPDLETLRLSRDKANTKKCPSEARPLRVAVALHPHYTPPRQPTSSLSGKNVLEQRGQGSSCCMCSSQIWLKLSFKDSSASGEGGGGSKRSGKES